MAEAVVPLPMKGLILFLRKTLVEAAAVRFK
jgi:hypothetical protein